jgi:hypothetical protein
MGFRDQDLAFQDADRRYAELKQQRDTGSLGVEAFEEKLKELMVQDAEGVWWARSPSTGEWHYHDGSTWLRSVPPYEESKVPNEPEIPIYKPAFGELIRICSKYDTPRFYVGDAIPYHVLSNARLLFPIPNNEHVAALLDNSAWLAKGFGLAVCEDGLRWYDHRPSRRFIEWLEFVDVPIEAYRSSSPLYYRIEIGKDNDFYLRRGVMDPRVLVTFLAEIRSLVSTLPTTNEL